MIFGKDRLSVGFYTAAALVHELMEARDEKRLLRLQRQLAGYKLLIIDELGYLPLSQTGAELLFEVFRQRYERGSTVVTSNRAARHPFVMAAVLERPSRILPVNSGRLRNTLGPGAWLHVAVRCESAPGSRRLKYRQQRSEGN
jgi:hypothetical protein